MESLLRQTKNSRLVICNESSDRDQNRLPYTTTKMPRAFPSSLIAKINFLAFYGAYLVELNVQMS